MQNDLKSRLNAIFKQRNLNDYCKIPSDLMNAKKAGAFIADYILSDKKILIVGDYDVDGICASAIMQSFFEKLIELKIIKKENFNLIIPDRFRDGYGINAQIVEKNKADLYITIDNGIAAFEAAESIARAGAKLIISDHHQILIENDCEILPKAEVVINPHLRECEFIQKDICGAVVAWYLHGWIKKALVEKGAICDFKISHLMGFLALSIISDVMPLVSLNRAIYHIGIDILNNDNLPAFVALREKFGTLKNGIRILNSEKLGFYVIPALNASGRLENAKIALDFLMSCDLQTANERLEKLIEINNARKRLQNLVFDISKHKIMAKKDFVFESENFVACAISKDDFSAHLNEFEFYKIKGVVGIVAAKLGETFYKNAFCFIHDENMLIGSARAQNGINLIEAIQQGREFLSKFGGHSGAAGLSLEAGNFKNFFEKLACIEADKNLQTMESSEIEVDLSEINDEILILIENFEPYGYANPPLIFKAKCKVLDSSLFGQQQNHQNLFFCENDALRATIFFNTNDYKNKNVDLRFQIKRGYSDKIELAVESIEA